MLTALAVLALAFAGFAIAAEQTDADGEPALNLDASTYYVKADGETATATMTISVATAPTSDLTLTISGQGSIVTTSDSPKIASGATSGNVTITWAADGNTTLTVSAEGYTSATATVYSGIQQLDGPAYFLVQNSSTIKTVTFKGNIPANLALTASSTTEGSKLGITANITSAAGKATLTTNPDATFVGSEVVEIKNKTTVVGSIIVYSDNAKAMAFVQNSTASSGAGAITNPPAAKSVQAMVYSDAVVHIDGSAIDPGQIPMVYFIVTLDPTNASGDEKTLTYGPIAAQKRMTLEIPGYILFDNVAKTTIKIMNWSDKLEIAKLDDIKANSTISFTLDANLPPNALGGAKKSNGTTDFVSSYVAPTRYSPVETAITSASLKFVGWASSKDATESSFPTLVIADELMGTGKSPKLEEYFFATKGNFVNDYPSTGTNSYVIFAIWDDKLTIEVLYKNASGDLNKDYYGHVYKDGDTAGTPTAKVLQVPSYAKVGDSFLLRIQQQIAGNYTYDVKLYTSYTNESTKTLATLETTRMITNGVWLVEGLSENIKIVVTAATSAVPVTGYHFMIDEVTSGTPNTAKLSWDAVDYKPAGDIKIGGTYFHQIPGIGNVYGDLSLLEDVGGLTYALTVDNVLQTTAPTENNVDLAAEYNGHEESYNFDFTVTFADGYTSYTIYAAQGVWTIPAVSPATEPTMVYTPWSLISQTSS